MKKIALAFGVLTFGILAGCGTTPIDIPPGKVVLTEYADLECGACKGAQPLIAKLRARFGEDLIFQFQHFPLAQHDQAFPAARASECARDQGEEKFQQFVDKAYEKQETLGEETFMAIADELKLDKQKFTECFNSNAKDAKIRKEMREGTSRGVNATPTFFLNGEKVENRKYEAMVKKIEELLGKPSATTPTENTNSTESLDKPKDNEQ